MFVVYVGVNLPTKQKDKNLTLSDTTRDFLCRRIEVLNILLKKIRQKLRFIDFCFIFFAHRLSLIWILSDDCELHNKHFVTGSEKFLQNL